MKKKSNKSFEKGGKEAWMMITALILLLLLVALPRKVEAGVIFAFAEAAQFTTDQTGCSKITNQVDTEPDPTTSFTANTVVMCDETDANGEFIIPIPIPKDMPSNPTVKCTIVYFEEVATGVVAWDVKVHSFRNGASRDGVDPTPANVDSTSRSHSNINQVYYTQTTTGIPIYDVSASADCSGTNCSGTYGNLYVKMDDVTTTINLESEFRMAVIEY